MRTKGKSIRTAYIVHDDDWYLPASIASFEAAGPVAVFVSRIPWNGEPGDWERTVRVAEASGAEPIVGDWQTEEDQRRAALEWAKSDATALLIPDSDEIIEPELLDKCLRIAQAGIAQRVYCEMDTYWKSPEYVVRPRERLRPLLMVDPSVCRVRRLRDYEGGAGLFLGLC